jgi:hypothetical protein
MPPIEKTKRVVIADFTKGLRQISNPLVLPPGFAVDLNNVNFHEAPALATRNGRTAFDASDPDTTPAGLFQFRMQNGRYIFLRAIAETGNVDYHDGSTWQTLGQMTATLPVYGVSFPSQDYFIFGDGVLMKKYDGTTWADLGGTPPALTCLEVYLNRLWGVTALTKLQWCKTGNPEDWSGTDDAGYMMVDNAGGDAITAIKAYRGYLFVWTQTSMFVMFGDDVSNFSLVQIPEGKGCYSHFSVVDIDGLLCWYGPEGIIQYRYGATPRVISRDRINEIIGDVDVNETSQICAGTDGIQYRLSLPGVTTDREIIYDPRYDALTQAEGETYHRYLLWRRP